MTTKSFFKILHTTSHPTWDGPEKRILSESDWFSENGHKTIIAAPSDSVLFQEAKRKKIKTYAVPFTTFSYLKDYSVLKRIIKNENPDIIISHRRRDSKIGLTAARQAGIPLRILWHHSNAHVSSSLSNKYLFKKACNYIFTNSPQTCSALKRQFGIDDFKVFHAPLGIKPFSNDILFKKTARQNLINLFNLENSSHFILTVAGPDSDLDYLLLLESLKTVEELLPDHHLILAGAVNKKLKKKITRGIEDLDLHGNVHFLNKEENPWKYARAFDALVIPLKNQKTVQIENIIENSIRSMHCSCPVIAPGFNELPELFTRGNNLLMYQLDNGRDLSRHLVSAVKATDDIQKMVDCAREEVGKNHLIHQTGEFILRLFQAFQVRTNGSGWTKN